MFTVLFTIFKAIMAACNGYMAVKLKTADKQQGQAKEGCNITIDYSLGSLNISWAKWWW